MPASEVMATPETAIKWTRRTELRSGTARSLIRGSRTRTRRAEQRGLQGLRNPATLAGHASRREAPRARLAGHDDRLRSARRSRRQHELREHRAGAPADGRV